MERLFLECIVKAALLVGSAAFVLYAMRIKAAAAKHRIWAGVVSLMLILPIWAAWGPKASLRLLPALTQATANEPSPLAYSHHPALLPLPLVSTWSAVLLGVYSLGLSFLLFRLAIGTVRARTLVRESVLLDRVRTSPLCAVPITVGFLRPVVVFPEQWRQWPQAQLDAVLTHEGEHVRRRDSLVQWLALLNRALFWFHPAAWWLERNLRALAEEACDNEVLSRGHDPQEYAECLLDIARSVTRSGARLNLAGMPMPGSFLPQRIRKIMAGGQATHISRTRMACVVAACAITCLAIAVGKLDHAVQASSIRRAATQAGTALASHPTTKFVLGDLKIEGEVHDRDGVRDRIVGAWKGREYDDAKKLIDEVLQVGIRADFQDRGYFKVVVTDVTSQPLSLIDGKQAVAITTSVTEGNQYRIGTIRFQTDDPKWTLSIPAETLREQFQFHTGDLLKVSEIRAGLAKVYALYGSKHFVSITVEPNFNIREADRVVDLSFLVMEGQHTP